MNINRLIKILTQTEEAHKEFFQGTEETGTWQKWYAEYMIKNFPEFGNELALVDKIVSEDPVDFYGQGESDFYNKLYKERHEQMVSEVVAD